MRRHPPCGSRGEARLLRIDNPLRTSHLMSGKTFGLIGAVGYVAGRHMRAMLDVGGALSAALDPNDCFWRSR